MPNYAAYRCVQAFLRGLGRVLWRVQAEGWEKVPPTGPVILATTHESFLDPLIVGAYCPRHTWYMARRTLFYRGERRSRFLTWFGALWGIIEVDREGTGLGALRAAEAKLREGEMVLIFPEGTRSKDGEVQDFRPGIGLLVQRTGAQVVPVSIDGSRRIWPRGRRLPRFGKGPVRLVYGEPVRYDDTTDPKAVAADVRRRVLDLRGAVPDNAQSS